MEYDLEYNSERSLLIIPEYGRHLQKLVDHCVSLETKEERTKMAKAIIDVMGNLQPHLRDVPDFKHKLWDQIFIMSDYKLDVDSNYEKPEREVLEAKPTPLNYPKSASKYRFYGNNIQTMIDVALSWEEGEKREALVYTIANHMKKCYLNWNKDTVEDAIIFKHLKDLSQGSIDLTDSEEILSDSAALLKSKGNKRHNNHSNHSNHSNNRNHRNKNRR
jgi:hypothetical protein